MKILALALASLSSARGGSSSHKGSQGKASSSTEPFGIRSTRFERWTPSDACRPSDRACRRAAFAPSAFALADLAAAPRDIIWVAAEWIPRDLGNNRGEPDPLGNERFVKFAFGCKHGEKDVDVFVKNSPRDFERFDCGGPVDIENWGWWGPKWNFDASARLPYVNPGGGPAFALTFEGDLRWEYRGYEAGWSEIVYRPVKLEDFAEIWEEEQVEVENLLREAEAAEGQEGHGSLAYVVDLLLYVLGLIFKAWAFGFLVALASVAASRLLFNPTPAEETGYVVVPKPDIDSLNISVRDKAGEQTYFKVKKTTKFDKVFSAYARRKNVDPSHLCFSFGGGELGDETPGDVEMDDGAVVDVAPVGGVVGEE